MSWLAQDTLGNREQEKTAQVSIDKTAPVSSMTLAGPVFQSVPGEGPVFVASHTLVSLAGEDPVSNQTASGLNRIMFGLDGAPAVIDAAVDMSLAPPMGARVRTLQRPSMPEAIRTWIIP